MSALIEKIENEFRVSHRVVAEQTDNQERNVLDFITRHKNHFEEFGVLRFKNGKTTNTDLGNGRPSKTYYLNEQQATFLMTLLRNSPKVVIFKKALVKAFYELKEKVSSKVTQIEETYFEKIYFPHQVINIQDEDFRKALFLAHTGKCFYTNEPLDKNNFHIDHIIPKSKGGKDTVANCVPCLPAYNLQKSDKLLGNSDKIIEYAVSSYGEIVMEIFNNIKTAKAITVKHNRVTMAGLRKNVMKDFDERYGYKVMAMYYAEVFGIPYEYDNYQDKLIVIQFIKENIVSVNTLDKEKDYIEFYKIFQSYQQFCWAIGCKSLRENDFFYTFKKYSNADEFFDKSRDFAYMKAHFYNLTLKQ